MLSIRPITACATTLACVSVTHQKADRVEALAAILAIMAVIATMVLTRTVARTRTIFWEHSSPPKPCRMVASVARTLFFSTCFSAHADLPPQQCCPTAAGCPLTITATHPTRLSPHLSTLWLKHSFLSTLLMASPATPRHALQACHPSHRYLSA